MTSYNDHQDRWFNQVNQRCLQRHYNRNPWKLNSDLREKWSRNNLRGDHINLLNMSNIMCYVCLMYDDQID